MTLQRVTGDFMIGDEVMGDEEIAAALTGIASSNETFHQRYMRDADVSDALRQSKILRAAVQTIAALRERADELEAQRDHENEVRINAGRQLYEAYDELRAARRRIEEQSKVLRAARAAIATLDEEALGRDPRLGYPYAAELLSHIDAALSGATPDTSKLLGQARENVRPYIEARGQLVGTPDNWIAPYHECCGRSLSWSVQGLAIVATCPANGEYHSWLLSGATPDTGSEGVERDTRRDCTCLGTCRGADGLGKNWRCALGKEAAAPAMGSEQLTVARPKAPPTRRGRFYCSPWCGGGCTWESYQDACRDARALCAELGDGWEPRVWENLGWHFEAKNGVAEMHKFSDEHYWLAINSVLQITGEGTTADEALADAAGKVRALLDDISRDVRPLRCPEGSGERWVATIC